MTEVPSAPPQFDFGRPFSYVFDDPRWPQKIGIGGLFYLAGFFIIGWFFLLGYIAQTTRNVIAGVAHPLPEWEDLGEFFNEGARLVAVAVVWCAPFFILGLAIAIPAIALDFVDGHEALQTTAGLIIGCLACLLAPIWAAIFLLLPTAMLFAIVERRFGAAFSLGRIFRFIRDNVGNYLLAILVLIIARFIGGAGVGVLCIGVIFTGFWSMLISAHGFAQVYRTAPRTS